MCDTTGFTGKQELIKLLLFAYLNELSSETSFVSMVPF